MRLLYFTIALLAVCVGLSLWVAASESARLNQSATWPKADATIVDSSVRDRGSQTKKRFCPYVIYRYTVGGVLYDSTNVRFDRDLSQCGTDRQWANDIIRPYRTGSTVPVFYDPAQPGKSTLEIHKMPLLKLFPKTGLIASFIALLLVIRQLRSAREPRVPQLHR